MLERQDELITSAVTLGEVLAGAYRKGPQARAAEIREALLSLVDEVIPFTVETADSYARIRGTGGVAASDAIHLACAATAPHRFISDERQKASRQVCAGNPIHCFIGLTVLLKLRADAYSPLTDHERSRCSSFAFTSGHSSSRMLK